MKRRTDAPTHRRAALVGLLLCVGASVRPCVGSAQTDDGAQRIAQQVIPAIERVVGLRFRRPPVIAVRSREQVRQYLTQKVAAEYPPAELEASQRTYRAFRLIPDTLDLRRLIVDLYSEQVAGFYDPDSSALFVVRGADPGMMRFIMAHELVHALQGQYTNLNAILKLRRQNDRQMAGQAVMEGQAMVASIVALMPPGQSPDLSQLWGAARQAARSQQEAMPVFAAAPLILRERLLFPYLSGGEFMQGFEERRSSPTEMPFNERLPISTEQILHFSRYTARERPARLAIAPVRGDTVVYDDDLGEFETRVALMSWGAGEGDAIAAAAGWNGDRYAVFGTRAGTVLVWAVAWDTPDDAREFERTLRRVWQGTAQGRAGAGRRFTVDTIELNGIKVVRLVDAPAGWSGWTTLPVIRLTKAARDS